MSDTNPDPRTTMEIVRDPGAHAASRPVPEISFNSMRVLVLDDQLSVGEILTMLLGRDGFSVTSVSTVAEALEELDRRAFDIAIIDKNLPDGTGFDVLRHIADQRLDCATLMMTGYANVSSVVEALRLGVSDYLIKPFKDLAIVRSAVQRAARMLALERQNAQLIAALRASNEALAALAVRDPLTKLFNHAYLQETIEREVARSRRHDLQFALMFIDINQFRHLNESLGHVAGDRALQVMAEILHAATRQSEESARTRGADVIARYGSDTFAVLLPATSKLLALGKAEGICGRIEAFDFEGRGLPAQSVAIGVSGYPDDGEDRVELIRAAELALGAAQRGNDGAIVSYSGALAALEDAEANRYAQRVKALDRSITSFDFDFVYQPIVRADDRGVMAYEALCRPRAVEFDGPLSLIETAQRAGKIGPLGRALRECNVSALEVLPDDVLMFVNLHPGELYEPEFVANRPRLADWAPRVVFELTEVAYLEDAGLARDIIQWLRGFGFRIALDDLGAGYSGLNSLARLEPDFVKLDMELIRHAKADARTRRLIRHIVEFASDEGIETVAEGIETEEEREMVVSLGVHFLQGYLFGRGKPMPEPD